MQVLFDCSLIAFKIRYERVSQRPITFKKNRVTKNQEIRYIKTRIVKLCRLLQELRKYKQDYNRWSLIKLQENTE